MKKDSTVARNDETSVERGLGVVCHLPDWVTGGRDQTGGSLEERRNEGLLTSGCGTNLTRKVAALRLHFMHGESSKTFVPVIRGLSDSWTEWLLVCGRLSL